MAQLDVSSEMLDKVYEIVEVARATGKLKKGSNEVTKAIERGTAKFVVVAKDVNPPEIVMHIPILCEEKKIPCVQVPSKEELGASAGIGLPTASIAVIIEGEAKDMIKEIVSKTDKSSN